MRKRFGPGRGLAVALAAISLGVLAPGTRSAEGQSPASRGDFAGSVEIPGGRHLYLECHGSGSPTVIFEAGLRSRGDIPDDARVVPLHPSHAREVAQMLCIVGSSGHL